MCFASTIKKRKPWRFSAILVSSRQVPRFLSIQLLWEVSLVHREILLSHSLLHVNFPDNLIEWNTRGISEDKSVSHKKKEFAIVCHGLIVAGVFCLTWFTPAKRLHGKCTQSQRISARDDTIVSSSRSYSRELRIIFIGALSRFQKRCHRPTGCIRGVGL